MNIYLDELVVEMENAKLDHEQEVLRLKALIPKQQAPVAPSATSKNNSISLF